MSTKLLKSMAIGICLLAFAGCKSTKKSEPTSAGEEAIPIGPEHESTPPSLPDWTARPLTPDYGPDRQENTPPPSAAEEMEAPDDPTLAEPPVDDEEPASEEPAAPPPKPRAVEEEVDDTY